MSLTTLVGKATIFSTNAILMLSDLSLTVSAVVALGKASYPTGNAQTSSFSPTDVSPT